jgi:hypothetical protein
LLAALAVFAAMSAAQRLDTLSERRAAIAALAVAAAIVWSLSEARTLIAHGAAAGTGEERSAQLFRPENVRPSRTSYMFFGFYPSYFSNSPMDPVLETRLVDERTLEVIADGSTIVGGGQAPGAHEVDLEEQANERIEPGVPIPPGQTSLLRFDFSGRDVEGVLVLRGRSLFREYSLPQSGEEKSFGSGPTNSHVIALRNTTPGEDSIRMDFFPDSIADSAHGAARPFARLSVEPLAAGEHVIELRSLLPFHAVVKAARPAVLETPKVYVPGYGARVNGRNAPVVRTGAGLVGVPLETGMSDVIVDYPGNPLLRWTYRASLVGWLSIALFAVGMPAMSPPGSWRRTQLAPGVGARRARRILPVLALACILAPLAVIFKWPSPASHREGALRVVLKLPAGAAQRNEPLVTTGRTGAGDVIYIEYLGHDRIAVGHDCWGYGGAVSKPFVVDFLAPQFVEVAMDSLSQRPSPQAGPPDAGHRGASVRWNGREILTDAKDSYPPGPEDTEVGKNMIGASTCVPAFSGEILQYEPIEPWKR